MDTIPEKEPFIQSLNKSWFEPYVKVIDMLRLDVIHPVVSGNKWYKLKHNIQYAIQNGYTSLLTFGGAYSNHLIATAAVAKYYGIHCLAIVRGIHNPDIITDTLRYCKEYGVQLEMVSREEYAKKKDDDFLEELSTRFNKPFIIPEGGANEWGREGSAEINQYIPDSYTHICVSVGTGTTLVGIRNAISSNIQVLGYVPMKGGRYLKEEIDKYVELEKQDGYTLFDNWHCKGFGKWNDDLINFMNSFHAVNDIPLDIVYTGKMMMGISAQLKSGYFAKDARILCIHTGGLQGNSSIKHLLNY